MRTIKVKFTGKRAALVGVKHYAAGDAGEFPEDVARRLIESGKAVKDDSPADAGEDETADLPDDLETPGGRRGKKK
jgi:hypothetical protein